MATKKTQDTGTVDAAEALLDDDATPADSDWADFSEEEFLKGEKGGKRDADDEDEEAEEDDDELDGFGFEDDEE
jgi:hypothetical protein